MSWNSVFMPKVFKRRKKKKKQGAVLYFKKKFPTFFVLLMGHEIFRLVVLLGTFLFNSKKNVRPCVRASVRACVFYFSACNSFVFHSNCLKFFEPIHYVWGKIVLTLRSTYPKGGTSSPQVTPNVIPL